MELNDNPTLWANWFLKQLQEAKNLTALATLLQAHSLEVNQLRAIDPVRVIHIYNLVSYRKQIEGLRFTQQEPASSERHNGRGGR